jgi:hypothetical protein
LDNEQLLLDNSNNQSNDSYAISDQGEDAYTIIPDSDKDAKSVDDCSDSENTTNQEYSIQDEVEIANSSSEDDSEYIDDVNLFHSGISFAAPDVSGSGILCFTATVQWVLLWVFLFQMAYRIPKAITTLLSFLMKVFEVTGIATMDNFPGSLYRAQRTLGMHHNIIKYVVCPKCHTLYDPRVVPLATIKHTRCTIEQCNTILSRAVKKRNKVTYRPIKQYPYHPITDRLALMLQNTEYEKQLNHPFERRHPPEGLPRTQRDLVAVIPLHGKLSV